MRRPPSQVEKGIKKRMEKEPKKNIAMTNVWRSGGRGEKGKKKRVTRDWFSITRVKHEQAGKEGEVVKEEEEEIYPVPSNNRKKKKGERKEGNSGMRHKSFTRMKEKVGVKKKWAICRVIIRNFLRGRGRRKRYQESALNAVKRRRGGKKKIWIRKAITAQLGGGGRRENHNIRCLGFGRKEEGRRGGNGEKGAIPVYFIGAGRRGGGGKSLVDYQAFNRTGGGGRGEVLSRRRERKREGTGRRYKGLEGEGVRTLRRDSYPLKPRRGKRKRGKKYTQRSLGMKKERKEGDGREPMVNEATRQRRGGQPNLNSRSSRKNGHQGKK